MNAWLFSTDTQVISTVHEVDASIPVHAYFPGKVPEGDLYIWDVELSSSIPAELVGDERQQQVLVVVPRKAVEALSPDLLASSYVLVKPVDPFTVRAFLEAASKIWQLRKKAKEADQLRCDREALLEYALATNVRLQHCDSQKTNFLARALHDLQAPLTALHGYCGLLAEQQLGPVSMELQQLFRRMRSSTQRLSRQASAIFDLVLLGNLPNQTCCERNDIEDVVSRAINEVYPLLREKEQSIGVELSAVDQSFSFDSEQVMQVVINILENCSKFTPVNGKVEIRGYSVVFTDEAWVMNGSSALSALVKTNGYRIDIQDNGTGIQPSLLPGLFEQHTSYVGGKDRSGGGLGLAICKMIISAHRGLIWAENCPDGAVFSFVLPFEPVPTPIRELPGHVFSSPTVN